MGLAYLQANDRLGEIPEVLRAFPWHECWLAIEWVSHALKRFVASVNWRPAAWHYVDDFLNTIDINGPVVHTGLKDYYQYCVHSDRVDAMNTVKLGLNSRHAGPLESGPLYIVYLFLRPERSPLWSRCDWAT